MKYDKYLISQNIEDEFEWEKWGHEIPYLKFDSEWSVKIIPPFAGAIIRFRVGKCGKTVSVYLDCYDMLGYFGEPYWEIYPAADGDIARFAMNDTASLIEGIRDSLNARISRSPTPYAHGKKTKGVST